MTDLQQQTYDGQTEIDSDPFGILDRDNRNHRRKLDLILDATAARPGDKVLEVGCGHGLHAERLADRFDYTGCDISETLVAATRERVGSDGNVRKLDATELPYPDGCFSVVVGTAILHHLPDTEAALREWMRVTERGGTVTLMEPNYLFIKDFVTAHIVPEEQHKTQMAPWRLRDTLASVATEWTLEPCLYTPPWPARFGRLYDSIDSVMQSVAGLRWLSQMLRIHIQC